MFTPTASSGIWKAGAGAIITAAVAKVRVRVQVFHSCFAIMRDALRVVGVPARL